MKTQYTAALTLVTGVAIGAVAVQGLHAQAKPPAYVVVAIQSITDPGGMNTIIEKASPGTLAAAGGHYVVRTSDAIGLEGAPPKRFVMIAFDNVEKARAWHDLPATKEITAIRVKSTDSISYIVEGVAN